MNRVGLEEGISQPLRDGTFEKSQKSGWWKKNLSIFANCFSFLSGVLRPWFSAVVFQWEAQDKGRYKLKLSFTSVCGQSVKVALRHPSTSRLASDFHHVTAATSRAVTQKKYFSLLTFQCRSGLYNSSSLRLLRKFLCSTAIRCPLPYGGIPPCCILLSLWPLLAIRIWVPREAKSWDCQNGAAFSSVPPMVNIEVPLSAIMCEVTVKRCCLRSKNRQFIHVQTKACASFQLGKKGPKKSAERGLSKSYPGHLQLVENVSNVAGAGGGTQGREARSRKESVEGRQQKGQVKRVASDSNWKSNVIVRAFCPWNDHINVFVRATNFRQ